MTNNEVEYPELPEPDIEKLKKVVSKLEDMTYMPGLHYDQVIDYKTIGRCGSEARTIHVLTEESLGVPFGSLDDLCPEYTNPTESRLIAARHIREKYLGESTPAIGACGVANPDSTLSRRDYFAAMAMQGILANIESWEMPNGRISIIAVDAVDALIAELDKTKDEKHD